MRWEALRKPTGSLDSITNDKLNGSCEYVQLQWCWFYFEYLNGYGSISTTKSHAGEWLYFLYKCFTWNWAQTKTEKLLSPSGMRQISLFKMRYLTPMQVRTGRHVAVLIKLNWNAEKEYVNIMARQQGFNTVFQFFYPPVGFNVVF